MCQYNQKNHTDLGHSKLGKASKVDFGSRGEVVERADTGRFVTWFRRLMGLLWGRGQQNSLFRCLLNLLSCPECGFCVWRVDK